MFRESEMFRRFSNSSSLLTLVICLIATAGALVFSASESHEQSEERAETVWEIEIGELCSSQVSKRRKTRSASLPYFTKLRTINGVRVSFFPNKIRSRAERDHINGLGTHLII